MGKAKKLTEEIHRELASAWYQQPVMAPTVDQERASSNFDFMKRNLLSELRVMYRNGRTDKIFIKEIKDNNPSIPDEMINDVLIELEREGKIKMGSLSDFNIDRDLSLGGLQDLDGVKKDYVCYIDTVQSDPFISSGHR